MVKPLMTHCRASHTVDMACIVQNLPRVLYPSGRKTAHRGAPARCRGASGKTRLQAAMPAGKNPHRATMPRQSPLLPQTTPCLSINTNNVKSVLPAKSVSQQLVDGFNSYFDGLGWALTMFAANQGWLGSVIQGQATQINQSLSNVGTLALNHPAAAGSVVSAAVQTYPWQVGARASTNFVVSQSLNVTSGGTVSANSSYVLAGAATYGTLAHDAFAYGGAVTSNDLAMAAVSGIICPRTQ